MILKGVISIISIYLLFYMTGFLFLQVTKLKLQGGRIVYGSVLIISIFEVISFPFIIIKNYFHILCYIFGVIIIVLLCSAFYFWVKNKEWKNISVAHVKYLWDYFLPIMFLAVMILQIYIVSYMHFNCYDDGYYIAVSNMALEQDIVELNDKVVYAGNHMLEAFNSRPGINCWELLIAFFAQTFAIHPAVLAHTFLPILLIPLCYMAVDQVMRRVTDNIYDRFLCLFLYSLLIMFYGTGYLLSPYLVEGTTWVGKALLFHLIIPLLLSECIDIVEEKQTYITWIKIGVIAVAGVGVTATGIYTVPIYLLSIAIPYILYLLFKHRLDTIISLIKSAVCSLTVFIIIGIYAIAEMIYFGRNEVIGQGLNIESLYPKIFVQDKVYIILFILSLILLFLLENSTRKKLLFIGQTAMLFLFVLNPVTEEFIAKYITGISVYWRMFLLLPVSFLIPLGGKFIMNFFCYKNYQKSHIITHFIIIVLVIALVVSGRGMFSIFSPHQNIYKIPNEILDICEAFDLSSKEMVTVLIEPPKNRFFRQYSSYFDVIIARSTEVSRCGEEDKYKEVCHDIYEEGKIDEIVNEYLKELGVEYIICSKLLENQEWVLCKKIGDYYIYEANGNRKHFIN